MAQPQCPPFKNFLNIKQSTKWKYLHSIIVTYSQIPLGSTRHNTTCPVTSCRVETRRSVPSLFQHGGRRSDVDRLHQFSISENMQCGHEIICRRQSPTHFDTFDTTRLVVHNKSSSAKMHVEPSGIWALIMK